MKQSLGELKNFVIIMFVLLAFVILLSIFA